MQLPVGADHIDRGHAVDRAGEHQGPDPGSDARRRRGAGRAVWICGLVHLLQRGELRGAGDAEGPATGEHVVGAGEADDGPIRVGDVGLRERRHAPGPVTLPTRLIWYVLEAMLGLMTPNTVRVSASPELMLFGTVKVTLFVPPPVRPAVTVPEPDGVVESVML